MNPLSYTITALADGGFIVTETSPTYRGDFNYPRAAFADVNAALTFIREKLDEAASKARSASGRDTAAARVQRAMT